MKFQLPFAVVAGVLFAAQVFAADTNTDANAVSTNIPDTATRNALLQIQAQLHEAQMAIADGREQAEVAATTNVAVLTARIQALEQTLSAQRANELETARKTQELTVLMAGGFGLAGLGVILLMFYFQWRGFSHLAQISNQHTLALQTNSRALPTVDAVHQLAAPGRAVAEHTSGKLLETVERLEKHIREMEQATRPQLPDVSPVKKVKNGASTDPVAGLLADGQTLLNANQAENALKLFEQALAIRPESAEAHVKRGGALEKLDRPNDAIAAYDEAIRLNEALTIAYLQKGGLFSRLGRYDEALLCYERALLTQDQAPVTPLINGSAPV
ncbi:MAG TPA: tetratricopeptide repeat protein [Verrucomicrobiae bacterium]|nr:tetratricopeptide repeat protein [Verrucomicrobiae bacterium]